MNKKEHKVEIEEVEIELFGRVQGVNMRNMIKKYADSLNLRGYAMNRKEGSVLIIAQGESEKLHNLILWIKNSPGLSKVEDINYFWKKPLARYSAFDVIREDNYMIDKAKSLVNLGKSLIINNKKNVPGHVLIIPDGNRRWARERGLSASFGHYTSASDERIMELFLEAKRLGVKYLSLWGFSTENWKRDEKEIKAIFNLILKKIDKLKEEAHKHRIRFRHLGRKDRLPRDLMKKLKELERETENYNDLNVQLLLDYGGRDEIIRAVNKILNAKIRKIDESIFINYLDSRDIPDPDLIIRTSGEQRTSGAMPFQAAYSELYFADVYFPEFGAEEFRKAIRSFSERVRRFGGTAKEDLHHGKKQR
ncbi:MAG: polyprenyl diphosphate synthase [Nanoarchaeota archaeon]